MKFAVLTVLDQTFGFLNEAEESFTIHHPEAKLFDTREAADVAIAKENARLSHLSPQLQERYSCWVEEVPDEAEFRARPDTW